MCPKSQTTNKYMSSNYVNQIPVISELKRLIKLSNNQKLFKCFNLD